MKFTDSVAKLISKLNSSGFEAYAVGGCVRDTLLGLTPSDWDVCTSARPEQVIEVFKEFTVIKTGVKHGTVTVIYDNSLIEVTTFRDDGTYTDNRHPDYVNFLPCIDGDLARRDFTINAMACSLDNRIIDLYGGQTDLNNKILRCVGEPEKRFTEDALRIMRALRFSTVYNLTIESSTSSAMHTCKDGLLSISGERIYIELEKFLCSPSPSRFINDFSDVFSTIFNITSITKDASFIDLLPRRFNIRLFAFCSLFKNSILNYDEICSKVYDRLKTDNKTKYYLKTMARLFSLQPPLTLADTRRTIGETGVSIFEDYISLKETEENINLDYIISFLQEIKNNKLCCSIKELAINGSDLIEAGIIDGKDIGKALKKALNIIIDENLPNEKKVILNRLFL